MTRVVTGAALLGVLQGVLVVLLLGPLGLDGSSGGWFVFSGSYTSVDDPAFQSSLVITSTLRLSPRLAVPLLLAGLAAGLAALAQRRGWLGARPVGGAVAAGRVGVAGVLAAVAGHVLARFDPRVVAFGRAREPSLPRRYADYLPVDGAPPAWLGVGAALAAAVVLVLLVGVREQRRWAWWALVAVLLLAVVGIAAQLLLLDGVAPVALAGEVLAVLLGGVALLLARRRPAVT